LEKTERLKCKRSKTILLVKNIPTSTTQEQLKEIFERYGNLQRMKVSPFNTLALAEFENA